MKRTKIQKETIDDIVNVKYGEKNIFLAELSTGSGKTYISLSSAVELVKKTGKSVIVSAGTSNNLVLNYLQENAKHNLIDDSLLKPIVGRGQYVDHASVLSREFLEETELSEDNVQKWIKDESNYDLVSDFIETFSLSPDYSEAISISEFDNQEYSIGKRIEEIVLEPKVYITNHFYLLVMYRHCSVILNKESEKYSEHAESIKLFTKISLIIDEVHTLSDAATMLHSNRFSLFFSKILLQSLLSSKEISTKEMKILASFSSQIKELLHFFRIYTEGEEELYISKLKTLYNTKNRAGKLIVKETKNIIKRHLKSNKMSYLQKKSLYALKKELNELSEIARGSNSDIQIFLSPSKKFPSYSSLNKNPIVQLRNSFFMLNSGFVVGLSGTLRVSEEKNIDANMWSLERIGIIKVKEGNYELNESQKRWNDRILNSVYFTVKERMFSKTQAKYYIFNNKRFCPPKKQTEELEKRWIQNIAEAVTLSLNGNVLVLMSSFSNCEMLAKELWKNEEVCKRYSIVHSKQGQSIHNTKKEYIDIVNKEERNGILIGNLSFFTGVDLPHHYINTLVIGKLPFESTNIFSKRMYGTSSSITNLYKKAVLIFRQGLGRGLRSPSDSVFISVCDPRILKPSRRYRVFLDFLKEMAIEYKIS